MYSLMPFRLDFITDEEANAQMMAEMAEVSAADEQVRR